MGEELTTDEFDKLAKQIGFRPKEALKFATLMDAIKVKPSWNTLQFGDGCVAYPSR